MCPPVFLGVVHITTSAVYVSFDVCVCMCMSVCVCRYVCGVCMCAVCVGGSMVQLTGK